MNYKKLGNTDINVSTICLGTMTWGEQNTQAEGFEQMNFALDQGVNFWDTAEIYSIPPREETFGSTEKIIGNWFEKTKKRDKVILASKVCGPMREYVRGGGNQFGKKNITEALEGSLKRLKTDYIDIYQMHNPRFDFINNELKMITLDNLGAPITSLIIHQLKGNTVLLTTRDGQLVEVLLP